MSTSQEIQTTEPRKNQLAAMGAKSNEAYSADASDLMLPRLYPAQKTSKVCEDAIAKMGQIVRSGDNKIFGGLGQTVEVMPIKQWKLWTVTEGKKIAAIEPYAGVDLPLSFMQDGKTFKRYYTLKFLVLLPSEIEAFLAGKKSIEETGELPDDAVGLFPYELTFKSTSLYAGKELLAQMMRMVQLGTVPHHTTVLLDTEFREGENGKYAVWKVSKGRTVQNKALRDEGTKWLEMLKGKNVKTDEDISDDEIAAAEAASSGSTDF